MPMHNPMDEDERAIREECRKECALNEYEAARRVVTFLQMLPRFRELIKKVNEAGNIEFFVSGIADAIRVREDK